MVELSLGDTSRILVHGRSPAEDGALLLGWPTSGFTARFYASDACVCLLPFRADSPAYLKVIADGREFKFAVSTGKEKLLLENLGDGLHELTVLLVTEVAAPLKLDSLRIFGEGARFAAPPAERDIRIEFAGDSITCGYGVLGEPTVPGFNTHEEDSTRAYAYMTAEKLGASGRYIAISGKGIVCNCNGEKELEIPYFYTLAYRNGPEWDFSLWVPDAVVINAGTNDVCGRAPVDEFKKKAGDFLRFIRGVYPQALIIWAYGMMNTAFSGALKEVIDGMGDDGMIFVPLEPISRENGDVGANGHPNVKASERVSEALASVIRNELCRRGKRL